MEDSENTTKTLKAGLYRHFKGNYYRVVGTARHSESEEMMVIYSPESNLNDLWVRPLSMFVEKVQTDDGQVFRFDFIKD